MKLLRGLRALNKSTTHTLGVGKTLKDAASAARSATPPRQPITLSILPSQRNQVWMGGDVFEGIERRHRGCG
ncbi:hypothetical protein, partial [uncultured Bradyrhizobium sp.]|uniref:hypothetical protein n=1 Tax=uncultured Bradyrhizobium sp. TaxID=199684 RepID=UPI0035C9B037